MERFKIDRLLKGGYFNSSEVSLGTEIKAMI